jgi:protein-tyrosine phosphatase
MNIFKLELPKEIKGSLSLSGIPGRLPESDEIFSLNELTFRKTETELYNEDEAKIIQSGITTFIRLSPDTETETSSPLYMKAIKENNLKWKDILYPIKDYSAPKDYTSFNTLIETILDKLKSGEKIMVSCGFGIGRSGTIAVGLLMKLGFSYHEAYIKSNNCGSYPESPAQIAFLQEYSGHK